jgi:small subunit ribosomal protein S19
MTRSIKKGPFLSAKLLKKVEAQNKKGTKDPIQTWSRATVIIPDFVGHTFNVHNGRVFLKVYVTEDMVGHRLGEFSPTRTFRGHSKKEAAAE